jgi:arabinogalactan endo-1,4-beta-galactosidase
LFPLVLVLLARSLALAQGVSGTGSSEFVKGADLSLVQAMEDRGVQYKEDGVAKDPLAIFKEHGCNYIRLRIFVNPDGTGGQVNTLAYTLALAKRAKALGFGLLLDFHYSDKWADPGKQFIPAAWKDMSQEELAGQIYSYTKDTLAAFKSAGCEPDMVQVGNEIINGMMWPAGGPLRDESKWGPFIELLKAGIRGVRDSGTMRVVIHVANGGNTKKSQWFFDHLTKQDVDFDIIGLSYYPFGSPHGDGTLDDLKANMDNIATTYHKDIMVAETGFFETGGPQEDVPFPATPEGQKDFLDALNRTVAGTADGRGKGVFYWAPESIGRGGSYGAKAPSNRALFDFQGNALPGMEMFEFEPRAVAQ